MRKELGGRYRVGVLIAAVIGGAVLCSSPARAQAVGDTSAVGVTLLAIADAAMLPPLVAESVYIAQHRRAGLAWPIMGFVFGAGGIALGLAFALPNTSSIDNFAGAEVAVGFVTVAVGAADIGLGVWSLLLPPRAHHAARERPTRWALTPTVLRDATGAPAWGAALSIVQF